MAETTTTHSSPYSIGRVIDYILGRNTLIGIASFMLLIISGYATWHGMRDFIVGVSTGQANSDGTVTPGDGAGRRGSAEIGPVAMLRAKPVLLVPKGFPGGLPVLLLSCSPV